MYVEFGHALLELWAMGLSMAWELGLEPAVRYVSVASHPPKSHVPISRKADDFSQKGLVQASYAWSFGM